MNTPLTHHMQAAVDTIARSKHPTNKVAACLVGADETYAIAHPNYWPPTIESVFGQDQKIGNSSGTIHAETACILAAPDKTAGASLFITDPPCPNCMKNIAEAGISNIYIDHKGFDKDFARRRGHHFENMSMRICEKAGINLFEINRKAETVTPILKCPADYTPNNENPAYLSALDSDIAPNEIWQQKIAEANITHQDDPFALCLAKDTDEQLFYMITKKHPTIGYTSDLLEETRAESGCKPEREISKRGESGGTPVREEKTRGESACKAVREDKKDGKYSFILQPINRILMNAARHGLHILPETLYSSRTPTARELINMIGENLTTITIGDPTQSRDEHGAIALDQLLQAKIISVSPRS